MAGSHMMFINRALPVLKKDARILGVALGGAYAKNALDEYSGLDFVIAAEPSEYEGLLDDRVALAEKMGGLLACFPAEHIQRPEQLICLFNEPLLHVDLNFQPLDKIGNRAEETVIIYEKDGLMSKEYAKNAVNIPMPNLQWFEDRFWIWVHYIATQIGRGEFFDAIEGLAFLRSRVLGPLLLIKSGKPPWGVREVELAAPDEMPRLILTLAEHNAKSCLKALKSATDLYINLRGYNKAKLLNREEAQRRALQFLDSISDKVMAGG